jgi:hypothetical protein
MTKQDHVGGRWLYATMLTLLGLLIAASAGAVPTRATTSLVKPRTLYIEHGTIHKFAQDGNHMAWIGGRNYVVHLRSVSGRSGWVLGHAGPGGGIGAQSASTLVLGGKKAVWVKYGGAITREAGIFASKPGQKKLTLVDALGVGMYGGTHLTGVAADGEQTMVYSDARVTCDPAKACNTWSLTEGGVHRIIGTKSVYQPRIAGIPAPIKIAVSTGRIAVVPAVLPNPQHEDLAAAPNGPVDVYDLSGHRLAQVVPQGTVREVALSWPGLAVILTRPDEGTVIEHFDAATGELEAAATVPGATNLAIGKGGTVFLVGKSIYTLRDGRPTLLWRSTAKPIGLSVEGTRVAWAANGRIKALNLPREAQR